MRQDKFNYKTIPLLALLSLLVISCNKPSPTTSSNEESSKEASTKVTSSEESTESSKESSTTTSILEETYTITWKNHDGTILEVDENVKKAIPLVMMGLPLLSLMMIDIPIHLMDGTHL